MRTLLQATPMRSLTWAWVAVVAAIALLSGFVSVLHGAVQRGEWKSSRGHAGVWAPAQLGSDQDNSHASIQDDSDVLPPEDVAAVLKVVAR